MSHVYQENLYNNDEESIIASECFNKIINITNITSKEEIDELYSQMKFIFWIIKDENIRITDNEFDSILNMLLREHYENKYLFEWMIETDSEFLTILTKKNKMTDWQFSKIIAILSENPNNAKLIDNGWIDNLLILEFDFTEKNVELLMNSPIEISIEQIQEIENCYVKLCLEKKIQEGKNEETTNMENIPQLILTSTEIIEPHIAEKINEPSPKNTLIFDEFKKFLSSNNSIIDVASYIIKKKIILTYEMSSQIPTWMFTNMFVNEIIENNLEPSLKNLELLNSNDTIKFEEIKKKNIDKYVDKICSSTKTELNFDFIFKGKSHANILYLMTILQEKNKLTFSVENAKNVLCHVVMVDSQYKIGYRFENKYSEEPTEEYLQIISMFLEYNPELYGIEFMKIVCEKKDDMTFDLIIDSITYVDEESLLIAIANRSKNIVKKLVQREPKFVSSRCIDAISTFNYLNDDIVKILIDAGLKVDYNLIGRLLEKNIQIDNLEKYNIKYDIELYKICHIHNEFPYRYVSKITDINGDLRSKIRVDSTLQDEDEIIFLLETMNTPPDLMMYEDSVKTGKTKVIAYLETKYNFKPTIETVLKINDYRRRMAYYNRYININ